MKKSQIKSIYIKNSFNDSLDIPDCFGEFDKADKICFNHCSVPLKCITEKINNPKIDILDKLINLEYYPLKQQ
jgi:hypothetical protein